MFCETKINVDPRAQTKPTKFDVDWNDENEHASITPSVNGISDMYVRRLYLTLNMSPYAMTVNSGDSALMVCTKLTGTRAIAKEEKMWPATWNRLKGIVVSITCRVGYLIRPKPNTLAQIKQYPDTKPNCTNVKVKGKRKTFMICLPVLFVTADDVYHSIQSRTNLMVSGLKETELVFDNACLTADVAC